MHLERCSSRCSSVVFLGNCEGPLGLRGGYPVHCVPTIVDPLFAREHHELETPPPPGTSGMNVAGSLSCPTNVSAGLPPLIDVAARSLPFPSRSNLYSLKIKTVAVQIPDKAAFGNQTLAKLYRITIQRSN